MRVVSDALEGSIGETLGAPQGSARVTVYRAVECWAGESTAARELPNIQPPKPANTMNAISAIDATAK